MAEEEAVEQEDPPAEAAESAEEPSAEGTVSEEAAAEEAEAADASQAGDGEPEASAADDTPEGEDQAEAAASDAGRGPIEALLLQAGGSLRGAADPLEGLSPEAKRILRLKVPVIVKLADKMLPLGDIIDLTPGSIVEFAHSADEALELLVNNKVVGHGVAVKVGEKFGLRIEEILSVEETIRSLGT